MEEYDVYPKAPDGKLLGTLLLEEDSPGATALKSFGAQSYVHHGHIGWLLGDIFYAYDMNTTNVLLVAGVNAPFLIEMPVTKISVPNDGELVFHDEDENTVLYVKNEPSFHLDIGGKPISLTEKEYTPSPW